MTSGVDRVDFTDQDSAVGKCIKVSVVQPSMPSYRVPLFQRLSRVENLSVKVLFAADALSVPTFQHHGVTLGFDYEIKPIRALLGGMLLLQQGISLDGMSSGDVLVLCGNPRCITIYPLLIAARRRGIGVLWWGHGWSAGRHGISAWIRRLIMRLPDCLLLYTEVEAQAFRKLGFAEHRVFGANNCIDDRAINEECLKWTGDRIDYFRNESGLSGYQIALFCGRVTEKARLDLIISALPNIVAQHRSMILLVIGSGAEEDRLRRLALKLGVEGYVRWLGEMHDESSLAPWFLSADCFVYPGAIGLSAMHALAYGLPVITHSDSHYHMPEFAALRDGDNALMFKRDSVANLESVLIRYFATPSLRVRLSEGALSTIRSTFHMDGMVERFARSIVAASSSALRRVRDASTVPVLGPIDP